MLALDAQLLGMMIRGLIRRVDHMVNSGSLFGLKHKCPSSGLALSGPLQSPKGPISTTAASCEKVDENIDRVYIFRRSIP